MLLDWERRQVFRPLLKRIDAGAHTRFERIELLFQFTQHFERVTIGFFHLLVREALAFGATLLGLMHTFLDDALDLDARFRNDLIGAHARRTHDFRFSDATRHLLLRARQAQSDILVCLGEDFLLVGEDFLRLTHLRGNGCAKLVDEIEQPAAIDHAAGADR
ncbi:MAG: hypothetical protein WEB04_00810 [Dehalococcoidia bacterium]